MRAWRLLAAGLVLATLASSARADICEGFGVDAYDMAVRRDRGQEPDWPRIRSAAKFSKTVANIYYDMVRDIWDHPTMTPGDARFRAIRACGWPSADRMRGQLKP